MKRVIENLASFKGNTLHLYLENKFAYPSAPEIVPPVRTISVASRFNVPARWKCSRENGGVWWSAPCRGALSVTFF
jgi:hypothetical protein